MRKTIVTMAACSAAALLVAGCGSKSTTTSTTSTADWAGGVCSAITTWRTSLTSAIDSVKNGSLSTSSIKTAKDQVDSATKNFTDTLKSLGKPNTQAGAQARQSLDQLSTEIDQQRQKIDDAIGNASSVTDVVKAAPTVLAAVQAMASDVSTTFHQLQKLDASGELTSAFKQSSDCKSLTKSS